MALSLATRLAHVETEIEQIQEARQANRSWWIALVVALLGIAATVGAATVGGAIAYGELRATAASNRQGIEMIRTELREIRSLLRP